MELGADRLAGQVANEPLRPIYLVAGSEPLLVLEAADAIRAAARAQGIPDREVHDMEGRDADWGALAASLLACGEQPASPAAPAAMAAVTPKPRNARRDSPRSLRDMVMSSSLFEVFSRHPSCDAGMTIRRSVWFAADPKG